MESPSNPGRFTSDIVEYLGWSSDGHTLAIRSIKEGYNYEEVSLLLWPSSDKKSVGHGDVGQVLQPLVAANDGETAYVWFQHAGQVGIWTMNQGSAPSLLGPAFTSTAAGQLFWTTDGIVITTVPLDSPGGVTISLIRWNGEQVTLRGETSENGSDWVSGDGRRIVSPEGEPHQNAIAVYLDGSRTELHPSAEALPLGMTPDLDAVVYTGWIGLGPIDKLVLHILPLGGGPERSIEVHLATARLGPIVLSSQGDLAYTGLDEQMHEICIAHIDFGKG